MALRTIIKEYIIRTFGFLNRNSSGKVIYYHDISTKYTNQGTPFELFKSHIRIIKDLGFKFADQPPLQDREIMICFDDGWHGIWDYKDFLIENDIHPTVFLIVECIGKEGYLNLDEIQWLRLHGFRFQGHTYNHKIITDLTEQELYYETIKAREDLSTILGAEVNEFCFPCGDYTDKLIDYLLSHGYNRVFISAPGNGDNGTIVNRNLVQRSSDKEFSAILYGGLNILRKHAEKIHHKKS